MKHYSPGFLINLCISGPLNMDVTSAIVTNATKMRWSMT
jgi:hypothetical protein